MSSFIDYFKRLGHPITEKLKAIDARGANLRKDIEIDLLRAEKDKLRTEAVQEALQAQAFRKHGKMPSFHLHPPLPTLQFTQAVPLDHSFVTRMSVAHNISTNPNAPITVEIQLDTDQEGLQNLKAWYQNYEKWLIKGAIDNKISTTKDNLEEASKLLEERNE